MEPLLQWLFNGKLSFERKKNTCCQFYIEVEEKAEEAKQQNKGQGC